jgi:predicted transcriptional regulator
MSRTHDVTISAFDLDRIESELASVTEQRDRLAEALRELCETLLADKPRDITELLNKAGDALAAVKGEKP